MNSKCKYDSMKFFHPPNFFKLFEQFQKLVAFLLPIFRNVDESWGVTSKLRGSTLIQVARRRSKVFPRVSASLVRVGDVQGVSRTTCPARYIKKRTSLWVVFFCENRYPYWYTRVHNEKFIILCHFSFQTKTFFNSP